MEGQPVKGSCLCGSVTFEIRPPYSGFRYCQCSRCRKASGSAHASNLFVPHEQLAWLTGEESIRRFDLPGAQRFAVWFCGHCGSRVPHRVRGRDDFLVPAGLLDADPAARPQNTIFCASGAPWYVEPSGMPRFPEFPK